MGRTAETRELEWVVFIWAWGARPGVAERADGFFGRSIFEVVGLMFELYFLLDGRRGKLDDERSYGWMDGVLSIRWDISMYLYLSSCSCRWDEKNKFIVKL